MNKGISLTELLIALTLSSALFLMMMQYSVFIQKQAHDLHQRVQQETELSWLSHLLRKHVQRAGYTPCGNVRHLITRDTRDHTSLHDLLIQQGSQARLDLFYMADPISRVDFKANDQHLYIEKHGFSCDKPLIIADCYHAEVHAIENIHDHSIVLHEPLAFTYHDPVYVGVWVEEAFFMKKNPARLMYDAGHAEELSSSVVDFDIQEHDGLLDLILSLADHKTCTVAARVRTL